MKCGKLTLTKALNTAQIGYGHIDADSLRHLATRWLFSQKLQDRARLPYPNALVGNVYKRHQLFVEEQRIVSDKWLELPN